MSMANDDALDDAIAHLDRIISDLTTAHATPSLPTSMQRTALEKGSLQSASNQGQGTASEKDSSLSASDQVVFQETEQLKDSIQPSTPVPPVENSGREQELLEDFNKAHLQVGYVLSVDDHPVADKLYVCKVEVAKGEIRQVVAGLRKFISSSELLGKKVCLLLNLKPAKLAGQLSQAMILAGEASDTNTPLNVKILQPQEDASVGDCIYLEDSAPSLKPPAKQLSSKIWEKLVTHLNVDGGVAKFNKRSLVTPSGFVIAPGLPDGAHIH